ncbi:MAG: glycosyltransferase, partial [Chloroflexota bacterium]
MKNELVSIIIPAYNQGHYLPGSIQSCLDQSYSDFEIIVVDDGSTDNTRFVVESFTHPSIKYIFQANKGLSGARNTGIRHSSGVFLTFLDSDDQFLPEKLSLLVDEMRRNPNLGFVAGQAMLIDQNGKTLTNSFDSQLPAPLCQLALGNPFHVGSVLVRRIWQEKIGFFDEHLRSYEDWDFWLRLALANCPMAVIPNPVSLYRFHTAQMTRNGAQMTTANMAVLEKVYSRPDLPADWLAVKPLAYSNAHLRAAAHGFLAADYEWAHQHLRQGVKLNPELLKNDGEKLKQQFSAWTNRPKPSDPLSFLDGIYSN